MAALVAALFGLIEAGRGLGANAADALFFRRFGVENLPVMIMLLGAVSFLVALTYTATLARIRKTRFFTGVMLLLPIVLLVERAAILLNLPLLYPVLWLSVNIISAILGILVWNVAGDVCDARQAKRLFSFFTSAAILGGVIGNFATGPAANWIGTENLLVAYAVLLLIGLVVTGRIARRFLRVEARRGPAASFIDEVRVGYDFVRGSPLLRLMALASIPFSILYFSISFPFSKAVAAALPGEADVAGFLGTFSGVVTAITFLTSLFVANRLYARIGVVNAVFALTMTYLIGFALFAASFSLPTAVIARAAQLIILGGIAGSAWSTFFNSVPSEKRGQVIAFDNGVPSQVGVALSGVLLILGERVLTLTHVFVMGMITAVVTAALVWRMHRAYSQALVAALRAGRYEVFTAGARAFAGFKGDAAAIQIACRTLNDPKPAIRRLAAQVLAEMGATSATPWLIKALNDPDAEVRAAAIAALDDLGAKDAAGNLAALPGDPDATVRARALHALPNLQPEVTPALVSAIETLLRDPDLNVRAQAAVALVKFGEANRGLPTLDTLLRDPNPNVRCRALGAWEEIATTGQRFQVEPIVHALRDESPAVRRAACRALGAAQDESAIDPLLAALNDPDESVRSAAAESLRMFDGAATNRVLAVLQGEDTAARDAALDALDPGDPNLSEPLYEYAHREIDQARLWRDVAASIPQKGRVTKFLREMADARAAHSEQRLMKTVGLLGHREAMEWVGKSLKSRDAETRATAVETLEMLGDKHLAKEIIPLLEAGPRVATMTPGAALAAALEHGDAWLRAFAARAMVELNEVESMETLRTVSLMERLMLLREVPLFAELSPDDLKQIADVAREQVYSDGTFLCREGEEGHVMYVLASGQVRVVKSVNGGEKLVAVRKTGDFLGEMSIIDSAPRFASVRAEGDVRALVIDGDAFKAILRDRPEVSLAVLRGLSRRLRERV